MTFKQINFDTPGNVARTNYAGWRIITYRGKPNLIIDMTSDILGMSKLKAGDDILLAHDAEECKLKIYKTDEPCKNSRRIKLDSANRSKNITRIQSSYRGELTKVFAAQGGKLRIVKYHPQYIIFDMVENNE